MLYIRMPTTIQNCWYYYRVQLNVTLLDQYNNSELLELLSSSALCNTPQPK